MLQNRNSDVGAVVGAFHLQTISLIRTSRPIWPKSIETYSALLSLDYTALTIPECLVDQRAILAKNLDYRANTTIASNAYLTYECNCRQAQLEVNKQFFEHST